VGRQGTGRAGALPEGLQHGVPHGQIGGEVPTRGGDTRVAEVVADHRYVDPGLQERYGTAVPEHVRGDPLAPEGGGASRREGRVLPENVRDAIAGEMRTSSVHEDRLVGGPGGHHRKSFEGHESFPPERTEALIDRLPVSSVR
jgi:hypothetical protein